jgi:hypothetical protein
LDRLGQECLDIAKQITDFVSWFKVDREAKPILQDVPQQRDNSEAEATYNKMNRIKEIYQERMSLQKRSAAEPARAELSDLKRLDVKLKELLSKDLIHVREKDERFKILQNMDQNKCTKDEKDELRKLKEEWRRQKKQDFVIAYVEKEIKNLGPIIAQEKSKFESEKQRIVVANKKAEDNSKRRKTIKTIAMAVQLEWNKSKAKELADKLERIRSLLYSEVMLNIQRSVNAIHADTQRTDHLLGQMTSNSQHDRTESQQAIRQSKLAIDSMMRTQCESFAHMDKAANERHETVIEAIDSFTNILKSQYLFPVLPAALTGRDPSLTSAALYGYETLEDAILTALYFPVKEHRETQIRDAHHRTCGWIFEDPSRYAKPWTNFKQWLEWSNGCYWIEGKAGCGKSTLMKFLISDERTQSSLCLWSGSCASVIASCFFWMAGSPLQKNEEGLLRSLLYTVLMQRRELISKVFPGRYKAMTSKYVYTALYPLLHPH